MTITSTQLGSTSILDNHKPQDSCKHVKGEQDDTCSQYKPPQDPTKDYNLDNQANYEKSLSGIVPIHHPTSWPPSWSPAPPPKTRIPLWRPSSTSPSDERGDTAVQYELPAPNDTLESGIGGLIGEEGEEMSLRVESNHWETLEVLMEDGPPGPDPPGGTSGPYEAPGTSPPDPNRMAVRRNLIKESSRDCCI